MYILGIVSRLVRASRIPVRQNLRVDKEEWAAIPHPLERLYSTR